MRLLRGSSVSVMHVKYNILNNSQISKVSTVTKITSTMRTVDVTGKPIADKSLSGYKTKEESWLHGYVERCVTGLGLSGAAYICHN
jgi:hypothetical protein